MNKDRLYKVIWIDDEVDKYFSPEKIEEYQDDYHIRVLNETYGKNHEYSGDTQGLTEMLGKYADEVEAVILDINYNDQGIKDVDNGTVDGFITSMATLCAPQYSDIPVFVFSNKPDLLEDKSISERLKKRICTGKAFSKLTQEENLFRKLKEEVDNCKSIKFLIKKRYWKELSAAGDLENYKYKERSNVITSHAQEDIRNWLIAEHEGKLVRTDNYFAQIRGILERMQTCLEERGLIPCGITLNQWGYLEQNSALFVNKDNPNDGLYCLNEDYEMDKTERYMFKFLIDLTQDGSHNKEGLQLYVQQHVNSTKSIEGFVVCLHLLMEILRCFFDIICKIEEKRSAAYYLFRLGDIVMSQNDDIDKLFYNRILLKSCCVSNTNEYYIKSIGINKVRSTNKTYPFLLDVEARDVDSECKESLNKIETVKCIDGMFIAGRTILPEESVQGIYEGDKILLRKVVPLNPGNFYLKALEYIPTYENKECKIEKDQEGNWHIDDILVKSACTKSVDYTPEEKVRLGKVDVNTGILMDKYPLVAKGISIEEMTIPILPGYIFSIKQKNDIFTAHKCIVEGNDLNDGCEVVVKSVISNRDPNSNSEYKVRLLVESYNQNTIDESEIIK